MTNILISRRKPTILFFAFLFSLFAFSLAPNGAAQANGVIDVENPDWDNFRIVDPTLSGLYWFDSHFMLSDMLDQVSADAHAQRQVVPVRIHNRGSQPLQITGLSFSDPSNFTLPNGETAFSIPANDSYILEVEFTPALSSLPNDEARVIPGELYIQSSDPATPTFTVTLRAMLMERRGGPREPLTQDLMNEMFGFQLDFGTWIGDDKHPHNDSAIPADPIGDEVHAKFWTRANTSEPIYTRFIVSYAGRDSDEYARMIFDQVDGNGNSEYTLQRDGFHSQTVLPESSVSFHSWETAPPGSSQNLRPIENNGDFYYLIAGPGSEQCVGACDRFDTDQPKGQGVRTFPARDPEGRLVPNTYVVMQDLNLFSGANWDYQDHILLVTNVRPVEVFTDLEASVVSTPNPVQTGETVTLTYTVYNAGVYPAQNTAYSVLLPDGALDVQAITPGQGSCSGTTCNLGTVAPDQTVNINVTATVNAVSSFTADGFVSTSVNELQTNDNGTRITISVTDQDNASLTVIKEATPESDTAFDFNGTGGIGAFQLTDDGVTTPNNFFAKINIQEEATPIEDFTPDIGEAYGLRSNGETYGWLSSANDQPVNVLANIRDRLNKSTPFSTMIHAQFADCCNINTGAGEVGEDIYWEHAVPNGRYRVTVAVGDRNKDATTGTFHAVNVEGVRAVNFAPLYDTVTQHKVGTVVVNVTDGRLTIAPDSQDAFNTKMHYFIIEGVPQTNNEITFYDLAAGDYDITETIPAGWQLSNITCEGATSTSIQDGVRVTLASGTNATCTFSNTQDDDSTAPPAVTTNETLIAAANSTTPITQSVLETTDSDTGPQNLTYNVGTPPSSGTLLVGGSASATFTQEQINAGQVAYQHNGNAQTADGFAFTVTDGVNVTSGETFLITIQNNTPTVTTNETLMAAADDTTTITQSVLETTDSDTGPQNLTYNVGTPPSSGTLLVGGSASATFTQEQINAGQVAYQHNGNTQTADGFAFTVTDGVNVTSGETFLITIQSSVPSIVNNQTLTAGLGTVTTINSDALAATDEDTDAQNLVFNVTTPPTQGALLVGSTPVNAFTQAQINANAVSYEHTGSAPGTDSFTFTVTDGRNITPAATFNINIEDLRDAPVVVANNPLQVDNGGGAAITATLLRTTDGDTAATGLTYNIVSNTSNGTVQVNGSAATTFTQAQIDADAVSYQHNGSMTTTDSFTFTVTDSVRTTAVTTFDIEILPLTDPAPIRLVVDGDTSTYPLDVDFTWRHRVNAADTDVPADWYNVVITTPEYNVVLDEWVEASAACTGIECALPFMDSASEFLTNQTYSWWVIGWAQNTAGNWENIASDEANFTVTFAPTQEITRLRVLPNQGRPTIAWDDDPAAAWFNIWFGNADTTVFYEWVPRADVNCNGTRCRFNPDINPLGGTYQVWMRAWGPLGFSAGGIEGWVSFDPVEIPTTPPDVVTSLSADVTGDGVTLNWQGAERATWYQVWIGRELSNGSYTTDFTQWYSAETLSCANAEQCTLSLPGQWPAFTYSWTVQAWGPGGFNGGDQNASAALQTFTVP